MMKLTKIKIIHFGKLSNLTFSLPSKEIDVFFGENEAGKSTTVAFIKQILFGFYLRSNKAPFFEEYEPLAAVSPMGGSLFFELGGSEFELERLWTKGDKSKKGTLTVKKDGHIVPESLFFDNIQNIDGSFYADSFIFNQDTLAQIMKLTENDLVEQIYYLGAAKSTEFLSLRDKFDKEAGTLFKKLGKKPEVNQLLNKRTDELADLSQKQVEFSDYKVLEDDLNKQRTEYLKVQSEYKENNEKLIAAKDLEQKLASYKKYQALKKEFKEVNFSEKDFDLCQSLVVERKNLLASLEESNSQLKSLQESDFDQKQAEKLLLERSSFVEWKNQLENKKYELDKKKKQREQLVALYPFLKKLEQLDANELQRATQKISSKGNSNKSQFMPWIIGLVVMGAFSWMISPILTLLLFILVGYLGIKEAKRKASIREDKANLASFVNKYGFDPNKQNFNLVIEKLNQLKEIELDINNFRSDIENLQSKLQNYTVNLGRYLQQSLSLEDVNEALNNLELTLRQQNVLVANKASLIANIESLKNKLEVINNQINDFFLNAKVKTWDEYLKLREAYFINQEQENRLNALSENFKEDQEKLHEILLDENKWQQEIADLKKQNHQLEVDLTKLNQNTAEIKVKMENFANSDEIERQKQEIETTNTQLNTATSKYLAYVLASQIITRALDIASGERLPKMLVASQEYFTLLTNGNYQAINFGKTIKVTDRNSKKIEIKYLSRATKEQLYFALKLSFAKQIQDEINLPILIDDSFVNFDHGRTENIMKLLEQLSQENQIIIFTARKALADALTKHVLTFER
ncbi:AAA family ATPase [Lactobacillus jensenii]|nr:AAA family ATPase [Lactobacillus jensenii]MBW8449531.1 AAA family ATPase [Lactobacillus jensenii]MCF1778063.1 AAA family ATPase [Lactobacillus jensenii]MCF1828126.1 AAA family ATPase [Lactobacillus jensenii]MCF1843560.1 AAA family ATPase [Lactobacillus jensenii]MCF1851761.1 AAA family ATPase [Lactobacillus jensenii]